MEVYDSKQKVLLVKNLPSSLSDEEKKSFLNCFGPVEVRVMPSYGHMKHSAFIEFNSPSTAKAALYSLHQLRILDSILTAQYCTHLISSHDQYIKESSKTSSQSKSFLFDQIPCQCLQKLDKICPDLLLTYPSNPRLKYLYPEPNGDILINICSALLTVPNFYTQVLHLMNKMNLYPPFSEPKILPPILINYFHKKLSKSFLENNVYTLNIQEKKTDSMSESELESDQESSHSCNIMPLQKSMTLGKRKFEVLSDPQKKLNNYIKQRKLLGNKCKTNQKASQASPVFEDPGIGTAKLPFNFVLPSELMNQKPLPEVDSAATVEVSNNFGFGKMKPIEQPCNDELSENASDYFLTKNFITEKELLDGKLSAKEISSLTVFKNYSLGEPSCRLYIKNLHKKVNEKDLQHIFGFFVDRSSEDDVKMFDVRVMSHGRMKGQAFVGLSNTETASRALHLTNGFQLYGKPMVVSYARSAKPKPP